MTHVGSKLREFRQAEKAEKLSPSRKLSPFTVRGKPQNKFCALFLGILQSAETQGDGLT